MRVPPLKFDPRMREGAAIADLFTRIKEIEDRCGDWNGGDVVEELCRWFSVLGIEVDGPAAQVQASAADIRDPVDDVLARLLEVAEDDEFPVLQRIARRAGLLWPCRCGWGNTRRASACRDYGRPRPDPAT